MIPVLHSMAEANASDESGGVARQEDEDEGEEMASEDGASSLVSAGEARDEEPSPYEHLGEDRPRLCQQQVPLEVNGNVGFIHVLYDWETPNTLIRIEALVAQCVKGLLPR